MLIWFAGKGQGHQRHNSSPMEICVKSILMEGTSTTSTHNIGNMSRDGETRDFLQDTAESRNIGVSRCFWMFVR